MTRFEEIWRDLKGNYEKWQEMLRNLTRNFETWWAEGTLRAPIIEKLSKMLLRISEYFCLSDFPLFLVLASFFFIVWDNFPPYVPLKIYMKNNCFARLLHHRFIAEMLFIINLISSLLTSNAFKGYINKNTFLCEKITFTSILICLFRQNCLLFLNVFQIKVYLLFDIHPISAIFNTHTSRHIQAWTVFFRLTCYVNIGSEVSVKYWF